MESGPVLAPRPATAMPPRPQFERFGRYYLLERIGRGGMAEVFRAVTQGAEGFRRMFVVKRILADKSESPEFVRMFGDEARISAVLHHPNIVQVYDFGQVAGSYFLAMEYLAGKDLSSVMRVLRASNLSVPPGLAAFIAQQVALGLAYAHALRGSGGQPMEIVHRDVTPSNIMLLQAGGVKILDFGIAKASSAVRQVEGQSGGVLKGKLGYLSPEQARSEPVDGRADIFALGVTLWEMLTGRRLFSAGNELATLKNVLQKPVPPPSSIRPGVPPELDAIVMRALERDRERRYPDAQQMADELEQILRDTRYESQSLRRMLNDLFGEESSSLSLELPELPPELDDGAQPARPPAPAAADGLELDISEAPAVPRTRSIAPPFGVATSTSSPALPEVMAPTRARRRALSWALLAAGLAAALALAAAASWDRAAPALPAPPPLAATAPMRPALPEPAAPAPAAQVRLEIDSRPRGAAVATEAGERLGVTPLTLTVPRTAQPRAFVLSHPGYRNAPYTVTPERDATALIELPHQRGGRPRAGAASARDLGDGMTINPF